MSQLATRPAPGRSPIYVMAERYNMEPDKVLATLKGTVIRKPREGREATNEEVAAFVIVANQYGLNPWTKEIYAYPDKRGGIVPIVSVDGWSRIINNDPKFNGCEFEEVSDDNGRPLCTTCIMHVKGRDFPIRVTEYLSECKRNTDPWNGMPRRMLRHKAFIQAGRYAFSLSGIYDEDEGADILSGRVPSVESRIHADIEKKLEPPRRIGQLPAQTPVTESRTYPEPESASGEESSASDPPPPAEAGDPARQGELSPLDQMIERICNTFEAVPGDKVLELAKVKAKPFLKRGQKFEDVSDEQVQKIEAAICDELKGGQQQ